MLDRMRRDIEPVLERDPAARSAIEVVLCYPGVHAIWLHRPAHWLWRRGWFVTARLLSPVGRFLTGIEIHPAAKLGAGLFIDHGWCSRSHFPSSSYVRWIGKPTGAERHRVSPALIDREIREVA